jgi:hypothetical protein
MTAAVLVSGCAVVEPPAPPPTIAPFSASAADADLPRGWRELVFSRAKAPTGYRLVADSQNGVVVRATARRSASGLMQPLDVDPRQQPVVAWRWRLTALIDGADNTDRHAEDSPVRLLLFFDGDRRHLPQREQVALDLADMLGGRPAPYATLMYIWENRQPVGTVIVNAHSGRVRMVVAGSGAGALGRWERLERDYVADFERAFGEAPGRLVGVGIMTDTDNTGGEIEAFYGDIELRRRS